MNDDARELTKQWVAKAHSDWEAVEILSAHPRCPRDTVCFHCQQFVEKLLKAQLTLNGVEAPRTHNLRRLIQLAGPFTEGLSDHIDESDTLTAHGVASRYPDERHEIGADEMDQMVALAREFARILLPKLETIDND